MNAMQSLADLIWNEEVGDENEVSTCAIIGGELDPNNYLAVSCRTKGHSSGNSGAALCGPNARQNCIA